MFVLPRERPAAYSQRYDDDSSARRRMALRVCVMLLFYYILCIIIRRLFPGQRVTLFGTRPVFFNITKLFIFLYGQD